MAFFGFGQQDPYAEAEQKTQDQQTAFQSMKDNLPALGLIMGLSMLARNNGTRNVGQLMGMAGGDALNAYSTFQKLEEARKRQKQMDEERAEEREYARTQDAFRNDMAERKFGLEQAKMAQDMALARQRMGIEGARLALARQAAAAGDYTLSNVNGVPVLVDKKTGQTKMVPPELLEKMQATGGMVDPNNPASKKYLEDQGKKMSDLMTDITKKDFDSDAALANLNRLEDAVSKIYTGKGGESVQSLRQILSAFGLTAREDAAAGELMQSITSAMAIQARNLLGGIPGALSDRDMSILLSTQPSLTNTREGNMLIINNQRKLYQRQKEIARMARAYEKKRGMLDNGFYDEVRKYAEENPLFERKKSDAPGDIVWE